MVTGDMLLGDVLLMGMDQQEEIVDVLMSFGMHCFGCAIANQETLEEAAMVHGIDIDELLEALNQIIPADAEVPTYTEEE